MNRKIKISLYGLGLASLLNLQVAYAEQDSAIQEQGKALIQAFSSELKGELKKAIQEGGFKNGIAVCSEKASVIAEKHSNNQWSLKRTGLKVRNPANTATKFEREQLLKFQDQKDAGLAVSELSLYQVEKTGSGKEHRIMKAIPTQALCLGCHGDNLAVDVKSELQQRYPADQAIGFKEGDIRGAFSLIYIEH